MSGMQSEPVAGLSKNQILAIIERVEKVHVVRDEAAADLSDIYKEAKGNGLDVPALKKIVQMRRMDPDKRREQEEILDLYLTSIGMVD